MSSHTLHIRIHGHLRAGFGLAGGARATGRILEACGCALECIDLALASHAAVGDLQSGSRPTGPPLVDLVHTNPNILASNPELLNTQALDAPLRIGYWAWELEQFPAGWEPFFTGYHEIWCPSSFTAQALAQRSPIPVVAVPHLPDWTTLDRQAGQRQQQPRPASAPFTFLSLFDFWSTPERKNPAGVIRAFQQAFPRNSGDAPAAQLLIKVSSAEQFPEQAAALRALSRDDPRIHWIEALLSDAELQTLYARADALVSLHRAEGFGLTLAEAMGQGIPVIATGYSGNLEFMPPGSALLIPWTITRIERTRGDYPAGASWAEPHLAAAAAAMRRLAADPGAARRLGAHGRAVLKERLSPERLSGIVRQRLGRWLLAEAA
jgi:glycosyltransferase involved in cell wall biosynthesis